MATKTQSTNQHYHARGAFTAIMLVIYITSMATLIGTKSPVLNAGSVNSILPASADIRPSITHTPDQGITAGQAGASFIWPILGSPIGYYTIYKNGSFHDSGNWTGTTMYNAECHLDNLGPGKYNFSIYATNSFGNDNHSVIVTASPSPSPVITSPGNGPFTVGGIISWTATDDGTNTTTYTVYRNGSIVATGAWTSGVAITINLNGLSPGTYNFTFVVDDGLGGISQDEIIATVQVAPGTASIDGVIWGVVIAFGCACAFIVFKAVKVVPMSLKKRGRA